jgi:hypothetical protein
MAVEGYAFLHKVAQVWQAHLARKGTIETIGTKLIDNDQ